MKAKITQQGVYDAKGQRIAVGTVVNVKGDDLPAYLVGKAVALDEPKAAEPKTAVTNPAKSEG